MKTQKLLSTLLVVAFAFGPQLLNTSRGALAASGGQYSATLISPTAGQVLYPGQQVRVEWKSTLPHVPYLESCEMEIWLSLDGGRTYTMRITPEIDPKATYFFWSVPNTPSNHAVLDIRFGCEQFYPETYAPQPASSFVIGHSGAASH
jgi:hypothetical protein